jgi:glycosyltransferase involved in cell wall biosynthesis
VRFLSRGSPQLNRESQQRTPEEGSGWLFVLGWDLKHPGGVSQVVANLLSAIRAPLGREPLLLVKSWAHRKPLRKRVDGYDTVYAAMRSPVDAKYPVLGPIAFLKELPGLVGRMKRLLWAERIGTVNVHFPELDALVWVLIRKLNRGSPRLILSFHGLDAHAAERSTGMERWLWKRLLRNADEIVACSDDLKAVLTTNLGCPEERVHVIDNGVNPEAVEAASAGEPRVTVPGEFILSLGTFENKKGHDVLIRAFAEMAPAHPKLSLVIAGRSGDGTELQKLEALRSSVAVRDRIALLPDLEHAEAMRILSRASILALASRVEPFGIVILEGGALGKPVVATDVCGATHRLASEVELLAVPAENVSAMARALSRLREEEGLAARLGAALGRRVRTDFTWERIVSRYVALRGRHD